MNEQIFSNRVKWLTQALLISGALNIGLVATFVYFVFQEKNEAIDFELRPAAVEHSFSNQEILRSYSVQSYQDLLIKLEDSSLIEEGFSRRDLALTCLVAFHHFDIEKGLGGAFVQKRKMSLFHSNGTESIDLFLYPGLNEAQYAALIQFSKIEKWPLTPEGLFYEIQRREGHPDQTLLDAFYFTHEFEAVALLFTRSSVQLDKAAVLSLILQGNWQMIEKFFLEQKKSQDLSSTKRVAFLLEYVHLRSQVAARLLLETDFFFVCKRLNDAHALLLLELLPVHTPIVEKFAKVLLISPRSDAVWKKAAHALYAFAGEASPETFNRESVLTRFIPQAIKAPVMVAPLAPIVSVQQSKPAVAVKASPKKRVHIVQEGESLWKIAKKYHVSVDALMHVNHLETDKLKLGKELLIPEK